MVSVLLVVSRNHTILSSTSRQFRGKSNLFLQGKYVSTFDGLMSDKLKSSTKMIKQMVAAKFEATAVRDVSSDTKHFEEEPNSKDCYFKNNLCQNLRKSGHEYTRAIQDLNLLQSNTQVLALAKYKSPENILPLFRKQLEIAGVNVHDLDRLNAIHISGTKGKGSTCAFVESILRSAGLKTGFYNSPHLIKVTERIKINGQPIDERSFSSYFRLIFDRLVEGTRRENITMPSYFSFLTILAFHIFLEEKVDCAIVEVGIGGEYDPTNIIQRPVACGITTLDLDHTNILGNTIKSIAWTKAGIVKPNIPIFTIQHEQDEAMKMIRMRANDKRSRVFICKPLIMQSGSFTLGIDSLAQHVNAALACQLAKYFLETRFPQKLGPVDCKLSYSDQDQVETDLQKLPPSFHEGLAQCKWPGRCQVIEHSRTVFFLDGAHTKKSMENCLQWFHQSSMALGADVTRVLMVNVIGERDKIEVLRPLAQYDGFELVIFSTNRINSAGDTPKSETFVNMQSHSNEKSLENVKFNVDIWKNLTKNRKTRTSDVSMKPSTLDSLKVIEEMTIQYPKRQFHVLATGSLHFVGAILETLQMLNPRIK